MGIVIGESFGNTMIYKGSSIKYQVLSIKYLVYVCLMPDTYILDT